MAKDSNHQARQAQDHDQNSRQYLQPVTLVFQRGLINDWAAGVEGVSDKIGVAIPSDSDISEYARPSLAGSPRRRQARHRGVRPFFSIHSVVVLYSWCLAEEDHECFLHLLPEAASELLQPSRAASDTNPSSSTTQRSKGPTSDTQRRRWCCKHCGSPHISGMRTTGGPQTPLVWRQC